jgi:hypothetical protein
MKSMVVIKRNPRGEEVWRYGAELLSWEENTIRLEAAFNRPDTPLADIVIKKGDRFVETYYTDRWYNVYEIRDRGDGALKGWYCNVAKPAFVEGEGVLSFVDLALDLWVTPGGAQTVLDEDEFAALDLDMETKSRARAALEELKAEFSRKKKTPKVS